jgi:hypothetical protein
MRFVVIKVIHSPSGAVRKARLVITDAPEHTKPAEVLAALEAAGKTADFTTDGVVFGNHELKAEGRRGWPAGIEGLAEADTVAWSRLITPPTRGEGRRITLRLSPAEYASVAIAAQRAGESLQEWSLTALLAAARNGAPEAAEAAS